MSGQQGYSNQGQLIAKADYNYNNQSGGPPPPPSAIGGNDVEIRKYLTKNGWPTGLQNALIAGTVSNPVRYFICDDSGSMMSNDGHRVVGQGSNSK